jgi:hypothetical protein
VAPLKATFQPLSHFIGRPKQLNVPKKETTFDAYPDSTENSHVKEMFTRIYKPINVPLMKNNG